MFKRLYTNMRLPIIIIAVVLILFTDVISALMYARAVGNAYLTVGEKRITRAEHRCAMYLDSVSASVYTLSLDEELIDALAGRSYDFPVNKLNTTCNYSLKINAISAYSVDGRSYASTNVTQIPSLKRLQTVDKIKSFTDSDADGTFSFRTEVIADIYDNVFYDSARGVVTYCRKVYDSGAVVGYLFADILPYNLYNELISDYVNESIVPFITFNGGYFSYADNYKLSYLLNGNGNNYFCYRAENAQNGFTLNIFESKADYKRRIIVFVLIMAAVSLVAFGAVYITVTLVAKRVRGRLSDLAEKMNGQNIDSIK